MEVNQKELIFFIFGVIINIVFSALFYFKMISLTGLIIIVVGSLIVAIISSFQIKIKETLERLERFEKEQNKLKEKLKIHEKLINLEARIIALENKNGKKK